MNSLVLQSKLVAESEPIEPIPAVFLTGFEARDQIILPQRPEPVPLADTLTPAAKVAIDTGDILMDFFRPGVTNEFVYYARNYMEKHTLDYIANALQSSQDFIRPMEQIGVFEVQAMASRVPNLPQFQDTFRDAYGTSLLVFAMMRLEHGRLRAPSSDIQMINWLTNIQTAARWIAEGKVKPNTLIEDSMEIQRTLIFFDTARNVLPMVVKH